MGQTVTVVLDLDDVDAVQVGARDGDRDDIGFGVESVPDQLDDPGHRLSRSGEPVELIGIDLYREALDHTRVLPASCDALPDSVDPCTGAAASSAGHSSLRSQSSLTRPSSPQGPRPDLMGR